MFALAALSVHGHEPISLRYFDIQPDGAITYLTSDELDARVAKVTADVIARTEAERKKRLAQALRENLRRRKAQAKGRREHVPPEPEKPREG